MMAASSLVSVICPWPYLILVILCLQTAAGQDTGCTKKTFPLSTSFVCECSATHCDTVHAVDSIPAGMAVAIMSTKDSLRFANASIAFAKKANITDAQNVFTVNTSVQYQSLHGFGGAFTDSATMNILNVSSKVQDNLLRSYYSPQGIEFTFGRIPIASCDFSLSEYSYDDVAGDFGLQNFSLRNVDMQFKIPVIQRSLAMSKREVKLFGSPWSAPAWMKTNHQMNGKGQLLGKAGDQYHKTWANYFVRFLEEYKKSNLTMWGLTVENEPVSAGATNNSWQAMLFEPEMESDFVAMDLGPALSKAGFGDVKLMILDDQRFLLPDFPKRALANPEAAKYVSGIAVHWYSDFFFVSPSLLTDTHNLFPDKFLLNTEACNGYLPDTEAVVLGSWERGEAYSHSIIQDLSNWVTGWVDWNLALNMQGGPNWAKNFVDSPIIVDAANDVFYKQPMFYHLGHFSKFIPPGSTRIGLSKPNNSMDAIAFKLPDGNRLAAVILNRNDRSKPLSLHDPAVGYINVMVPPRSITTYLWTTK